MTTIEEAKNTLRYLISLACFWQNTKHPMSIEREAYLEGLKDGLTYSLDDQTAESLKEVVRMEMKP